MTDSALDIHVHKKYYRLPGKGGLRLAIDGVKLTVQPREFVCFVGPSGCGKTTLMNIVAGLDRDANAEVRFRDGREISQAKISYMFQTPRLLPWMSVRENVEVVLDEDSIQAGKAIELLEQMQLGDSLNDFPNRLSGGMQRRVALARAFVTEPDLLLLDEPFVSLDAPVANRLRDILLTMWAARPTTVMFVTHDLREAIFLADRIIFLSRGPSRIILDETVPIQRPRDIDDPAIEQFRLALLEKNQSLLRGLEEQTKDGSEDTPTAAAQ